MKNTTQQLEIQWYKKRDEWKKKTNQYKNEDIYKASELNMQVCDMINSIIISTRGPYPYFPKKINLSDLVTLVEQVWQDND